MLDIRLTPAGSDRTVEGVLTLPFGLALQKGVAFQVDDGEQAAPMPFSTCLPTGCLSPISLNEGLIAAMRRDIFNVRRIDPLPA